ncbi:MAG: two-component regulator propeller domain-containing protein [Pyrinomonadaceae bacterium]
MNRHDRKIRLTFFAFLIAAFSAVALAERLPFRNYSTVDGLPSDSINKIVLDSRGFLWFCTEEGLSRFDGYRFKNYTQEEGLPHRNINDIIENPDGTYFLATSNGLTVFDPRGKAFRWDMLAGKLEKTSDDKPAFETYFPEIETSISRSFGILNLARDASGQVLAGTRNGLFRVRPVGSGIEFSRVEHADWASRSVIINAMLTDRASNVWVAADIGIYFQSSGGEISRLSESGGNSIYEDRSGRVWVDSGGLDIGARIFAPAQNGSLPRLIDTITTRDGLAVNGFSNAVAEPDGGKILVSSEGRLFEFN